MRVAILDDYQRVALASADWSAVRSRADIDVFTEHIERTEALVRVLEPYDVVWLEDIIQPDSAGDLARLVRETRVPQAVSERRMTRFAFSTFFERTAITASTETSSSVSCQQS